MKKLFPVIVALLIITLACSQQKEAKESKVEPIVLGKNYGQVQVDTSKAVDVAEFISSFKDKKGRIEYTLYAPIVEVCSKAGCWINIDKGNGEKFMVRFKDHFTIPTDTKIGKMAYLHGYAYMDTISVDLLRHFAEDAGKSKEEIERIIDPKFELAFEADGIVLTK